MTIETRDFGTRRHGESEAQFCERRGREAEQRAQDEQAIRDSMKQAGRIRPIIGALPRSWDRLGCWEYGR